MANYFTNSFQITMKNDLLKQHLIKTIPGLLTAMGIFHIVAIVALVVAIGSIGFKFVMGVYISIPVLVIYVLYRAWFNRKVDKIRAEFEYDQFKNQGKNLNVVIFLLMASSGLSAQSKQIYQPFFYSWQGPTSEYISKNYRDSVAADTGYIGSPFHCNVYYLNEREYIAVLYVSKVPVHTFLMQKPQVLGTLHIFKIQQANCPTAGLFQGTPEFLFFDTSRAGIGVVTDTRMITYGDIHQQPITLFYP